MRYDAVAPIYDALALLYSGGAIRRAKHDHVGLLSPNDRVLYAGAGTGHECVSAARRGCDVTVIDESPRMVQRCRARFDGAEIRGRFFCGDALASRDTEPYDYVVAPFFLNVFDQAHVPVVLDQLTSRLGPGGRLVSVDFRAPSSHPVLWAIQQIYYLPPLVLFHLATHNPWHGLYDYEEIVHKRGLPLSVEHKWTRRAYGLPLFETIVWRRR